MAAIDIPPQYRTIGQYVKIAADFKDHDKVLYYWVLNFAIEKALAIGSPSDDASKKFVIGLLDVLEKIKSEHPGDESFIVGPVGQCHVEAKALRLFTTADEQDRQGIFNKNVVKAFYTSGLLFDVLMLFTNGELEEKLQEARKYAKWKATEINNCLKTGQTPQAGPPNKEGGEDDELTRELLRLDVTKPEPAPRTSSNTTGPSNQFNQPNPTNYPQVPQNTGFPPSIGQNFGWQQPFDPNFGQNQQFGGQTHPQQFNNFPPQQQQTHHHNVPQPAQVNSSEATLDDFIEARRLCKTALNALDFEDAKTAIDFLNKALKVLEK